MRGTGSVLAQTVPLGHRFAGAFADLSPVFGTAGGAAVRPQDQPPHHLVLGGAIKVDDEKLNADVGQEVSGDVIDERLVEDGVQSALLDMGFLLGDALSAVVDVHLDIRIWGPQRDKKKGDRPMTRSSLRRCGLVLEGGDPVCPFGGHPDVVLGEGTNMHAGWVLVRPPGRGPRGTKRRE